MLDSEHLCLSGCATCHMPSASSGPAVSPAAWGCGRGGQRHPKALTLQGVPGLGLITSGNLGICRDLNRLVDKSILEAQSRLPPPHPAARWRVAPGFRGQDPQRTPRPLRFLSGVSTFLEGLQEDACLQLAVALAVSGVLQKKANSDSTLELFL